MTANDNLNAEKLTKEAGALLPLGVIPTEDVAAAPVFDRKKPALALGSIPLKKRQHEQLAQLVAYQNLTFAQAYAQVYRTDKDSRANASRLKREHPEVVERIGFLDRELRDEAMLHRGSTFVETINDVNAIRRTMLAMSHKPACAAMALKASEILLKATGNDAPQTMTTTVEESVEATKKAEVLPGIIASLKRVVKTTRQEQE